MFSLKDKVVVVTGGCGILGTEFVKSIIKYGGKTVILDKNFLGIKLNDDINSSGGDSIFVDADIHNDFFMELALQTILHKYGRIDGLVNCAGGNVPQGIVQQEEDIFDISLDGMKAAVATNLWGTIKSVKAFGPGIAKNSGSIINMSSVSSKRALTKVLGYSMGKAALDIYTKWFAVEMANRGYKCRMNSICPGFFLTSQNKDLLTNEDGSLTERGKLIIEHTPFKRFGNPSELTGALIWLLSDASSFVTGADIVVDGGFTINSGV